MSKFAANNPCFWDVDELPFDDEGKEIALEYAARILWRLLMDKGVEFYGKSYDPLVIAEGKAHSYVFDFEDGGRHHDFKDYKHLEEMMLKEVGSYLTYTEDTIP